MSDWYMIHMAKVIWSYSDFLTRISVLLFQRFSYLLSKIVKWMMDHLKSLMQIKPHKNILASESKNWNRNKRVSLRVKPSFAKCLELTPIFTYVRWRATTYVANLYCINIFLPCQYLPNNALWLFLFNYSVLFSAYVRTALHKANFIPIKIIDRIFRIFDPQK